MKIGRGASLLASLVILGKLSGIVRDALVGRHFGTSVAADAYYLTAALSSLIFAGVLAAVPFLVVPLAAQQPYTAQRQNVLAFHLRGALAVGFLGAVVLTAFPQALIDALSDATPSISEAAVPLLRITGLTYLFSVAVTAQNALLAARGRVTSSYVVSPANNIAFILGVLVISPTDSLAPVLLCNVAGWALQLHQPRLLVSAATRQEPSVADRDLFIADLRTRGLPAVLSLYTEQATQYVAIFAASFMAAGAISTWSYANKVGLVATSVFSQLLVGSMLPSVASMNDASSTEARSRFISKSIADLLTVTVPAAIVLVGFSRVISRLMLGGTGSGAPSDIIEVAAVLVPLALVLPLQLLRDMLSRGLLATGHSQQVLRLSAAALLLTLAAALTALAFDSKVMNLAWAVAGTTAASTILFGRAAFQRGLIELGEDERARFMSLFAATLLASLLGLALITVFSVNVFIVAAVAVLTFEVTLRLRGSDHTFAVLRRYSY